MTNTNSERSKTTIRQAAIVILCAMLIWMAGSFFGGKLGLPIRFAFLLDLACLAAFAWALIVLARVWLLNREGRE